MSVYVFPQGKTAFTVYLTQLTPTEEHLHGAGSKPGLGLTPKYHWY